MSNIITTFSKVKFNPIDPNPEDLRIDDIAHSLSLMCRANGHFPEFYSVGQHSIACCEEAIARGYSNKVALACLIHDASEAYMSDVTRPVKKRLTEYLEIEENLQNIIYLHYLGEELNNDELALIKDVDDALLHNEFIHYMNQVIEVKNPNIITKPRFEFVDFKEIESEYKRLYSVLSKELVLQFN